MADRTYVHVTLPAALRGQYLAAPNVKENLGDPEWEEEMTQGVRQLTFDDVYADADYCCVPGIPAIVSYDGTPEYGPGFIVTDGEAVLENNATYDREPYVVIPPGHNPEDPLYLNDSDKEFFELLNRVRNLFQLAS